ncbi:hypothetical protein SAMN05216436_11135 [bacterium A37T11]|nr:hypothetical protein SAMN05216436_11135 [bacterium A37T11]
MNYDTLEEMRAHHFFCYEITLPPRYSLALAGNWMMQDLERYLNFRIGFKGKEVDVLYLKPMDGNGKDILKQPANGVAIDQFTYFLNQNGNLPLIIDKTGWQKLGCREPWTISVLSLDKLQDTMKTFHLKLERARVFIRQVVIE